MEKSVLRLSIVLLSLCFPLLTSCSAMSDSASDTPNANIEGQWVLTRIKTDKQQKVSKPKNFLFSLIIDNEGKAHGKVACNHWSSGYHIESNKFQLSKAATTRKMCFSSDPLLKSLEHRFLTELQKPTAFKASDMELAFVISDQETWFFTPQKK